MRSHPTIFVSVPRIYSRLYDRVMSGVQTQGWLSRTLFHMALNSKRANLQHNVVGHWLWDRLVFAKIRQRMGGRVRLMVTGITLLNVLVFLLKVRRCRPAPR